MCNAYTCNGNLFKFSSPLSFRVEPETDTGIYLHIERAISQSETGRRKSETETELRSFKVMVVDSVHATTQLRFSELRYHSTLLWSLVLSVFIFCYCNPIPEKFDGFFWSLVSDRVIETRCFFFFWTRQKVLRSLIWRWIKLAWAFPCTLWSLLFGAEVSLGIYHLVLEKNLSATCAKHLIGLYKFLIFLVGICVGFFLLLCSVYYIELVDMVSGTLFLRRKNSWPPEEYISRTTLQLVSFYAACVVRCFFPLLSKINFWYFLDSVWLLRNCNNDI